MNLSFKSQFRVQTEHAPRDRSTGVQGLHISESRPCHGAPCWGHDSPEAPWSPHKIGSDECGSQGAPSLCVFETVHTQTAFGVIMRNGPISQSRQWSVKKTHKHMRHEHPTTHVHETGSHTHTHTSTCNSV